jgi:DNA-binding transcriptional LysR family regulator
MLDVRRMNVLREVAARGSFSAAAESLSFTQSAVSQQVAALEREAGAKLVERGPRGVRLTDAGGALVRHADAIVARLDDAEQELAAIAGLRGGRLRLGSFPSAGATLVPEAVAAFRDRYPDVELSMVEAEPVDALPRLRSGELDLALVYDNAALPERFGDDLHLTHLLNDPLELVVPRGHPAARREHAELGDLAGEHWIGGTPTEACQRIVNRSCADAGFEPRVVFETDDYQAGQAFVAAGVGVAILPRLALTAVHPGVEVVPLGEGTPVRRVWAAQLGEGYRSAASEAMLAILRDVSERFERRGAPAGAV